MDGCLFGFLYLLWVAILGIFKLFWMGIVALAKFAWWIIQSIGMLVMLLISCFVKTDSSASTTNIPPYESENDKKRNDVEVLFSKVRSEIITSTNPADYPERMDVYHSFIKLYYKSGEKTIDYSKYGVELNIYQSWFTNWGREGEYKVNQPLLLANKINAVAGEIYLVFPVEKMMKTEYTDETMTTYTQYYVKLTKK